MVQISARALLNYKGRNFSLDMWPTDNLHDGTGKNDYRGHMKEGIVRDFVLKMTGVRPGYNPAEYPDHVVNENPDRRFGWYGGTAEFHCDWGSTQADFYSANTALFRVYPKGSIITVTLTPDGPLVDGLPGEVLRRSSELGQRFVLFDIPHGDYTATATLTEPSGAVHNLRISPKLPNKITDYSPSAPVQWKPDTNIDPTGYLIVPISFWLIKE